MSVDSEHWLELKQFAQCEQSVIFPWKHFMVSRFLGNRNALALTSHWRAIVLLVDNVQPTPNSHRLAPAYYPLTRNVKMRKWAGLFLISPTDSLPP